MRCYAYDHPYFVGFLQNVGVSYKMPEFALGMTTSYLNGPHYNLKRHVSPFGSNSQGCIHLLKIIAGISSDITNTISTSGNIRSNFLKP
jgi:hypothetical protein